jgi:hypothetical protein
MGSDHPARQLAEPQLVIGAARCTWRWPADVNALTGSFANGLRQPPDIPGGQVCLQGQSPVHAGLIRKGVKQPLCAVHLTGDRAQGLGIHLNER